ncbi:MAG TPA: DUF6304 family protein [Clostridium sp.]
MVKVRYSALYTDNLGCEQASVYFLKGEIQLNVRGCTFKSDSLNFDFYSNNYKEIKHLFYLKDDELIEYVIDIKIPLVLLCDNKEFIEEFLLRIERHRNYYSNTLSIYLQGEIYTVRGYDLLQLLINMKKELPKKYNMKCRFSNMVKGYHIEIANENIFYYLKKFEFEWRIKKNKDCYLNLFNSEQKREFDKLQKVSITYICDNYCLS